MIVSFASHCCEVALGGEVDEGQNANEKNR